MQYHIPAWAQLPNAVCSIFRYEENSAAGKLSGQVVKLGGQVWKDYYSSTDVRGDGFFVFFGHFAPTNEPFMCGRDVPGYIVERVQVNPAPYPHYGHAADFSWIAGELVKYGPPTCSSLDCGCSLVLYDQGGIQMQLAGAAWSDYQYQYTSTVHEEAFFVLFGHPARPGELYPLCAGDRSPGYIVDRVQANPTP